MSILDEQQFANSFVSFDTTDLLLNEYQHTNQVIVDVMLFHLMIDQQHNQPWIEPKQKNYLIKGK